MNKKIFIIINFTALLVAIYLNFGCDKGGGGGGYVDTNQMQCSMCQAMNAQPSPDPEASPSPQPSFDPNAQYPQCCPSPTPAQKAAADAAKAAADYKKQMDDLKDNMDKLMSGKSGILSGGFTPPTPDLPPAKLSGIDTGGTKAGATAGGNVAIKNNVPQSGVPAKNVDSKKIPFNVETPEGGSPSDLGSSGSNNTTGGNLNLSATNPLSDIKAAAINPTDTQLTGDNSDSAYSAASGGAGGKGDASAGKSAVGMAFFGGGSGAAATGSSVIEFAGTKTGKAEDLANKKDLKGKTTTVVKGATTTAEMNLGEDTQSKALINTVGTADPEDYFTRINLEDNIFKIVEKRYRDKENALIISELETLGKNPDKK